MTVALVLLEIDPSIVKPGWTALLVTVFIGAALVLLFFSLRRQVRRISPDLPYASEVDPDRGDRSQAVDNRGENQAGERTIGGGTATPPAPDITSKS